MQKSTQANHKKVANDMLKTDHYILGIDGGGTKTVAKLVNIRTQQVWLKKGGSASLSNDFDGAISVIKQLCQALTTQANCQYQQITAVFGIAGADNKIQHLQCSQAFTDNFKKLHICSDATTSVFGANLGKPVVVAAIGTGSVGMRLEETGKSTLTGGWGFLLGDEGSGAKLGLNTLKVVLAEVQKYESCPEKEATSLLAQNIFLITGQSKTAIIQWAKHATPADFATFSPDVFSLYSHCEQANNLIKQHVKSVEALIDLTRGNSKLPVVLLGGLASPTTPLLSKNIQALLIPAKGSALDGACLLASSLLSHT